MKKSKNTWPELFKAVHSNDIQKVKHLIETGSDVNATDVLGRTPLMISRGYLELTRLLIQSGAEINILDERGDFALWGAPYEVSQLLLEHGANINLRTKGGSTALLASHSVKVLALLLEHGANINDINRSGENILMLLAWDYDYRERLAMIRFVVDSGIDINAQNNDGDTALMIAIEQERLNVAEELLKLGADTKIKNREGKTALDFAYAYASDNEKLIHLIKNQKNC